MLMLRGFCFYILYAVVTCGVIEDILNAEKTCEVQFPSITLDIFMELKKTRDLEKYQRSHPDIDCFLNCMSKLMQVTDEAGNFNMENLKNVTHAITGYKLSDDKVEESMTTCLSILKKEDPCERVGEYLLCKITQMKGVKLHEDLCKDCD